MGSDNPTNPIRVSIVIPIMNEEDNVVELYKELVEMMDQQTEGYEVIFVDDGSWDQTIPRLKQAAAGDGRVNIISFKKNFGQTAAMAAGFDAAKGEVVVPMDGDRQNDPADVPRLVAKLDEQADDIGNTWDIVSGWRKDRQDKWFSRRLPSIVANKIVKKLTWTTEIHDFGCSLKAYRKEVLEDVRLYGEMHRFIPAICKWRGARVTEAVVHHRARVAGESKYGLKRTVKVLLDLITVKFLGDYLAKPIYFFGKISFVFMALTMVALALSVVQKFGVLTENGQAVNLNNNIFVLFAMMTGLISVMILMMGVLSELMARVYHESQDRKPYKIRALTNGADLTPEDVAAPPATPVATADEGADPEVGAAQPAVSGGA